MTYATIAVLFSMSVTLDISDDGRYAARCGNWIAVSRSIDDAVGAAFLFRQKELGLNVISVAEDQLTEGQCIATSGRFSCTGKSANAAVGALIRRHGRDIGIPWKSTKRAFLRMT